MEERLLGRALASFEGGPPEHDVVASSQSSILKSGFDCEAFSFRFCNPLSRLFAFFNGFKEFALIHENRCGRSLLLGFPYWVSTTTYKDY